MKKNQIAIITIFLVFINSGFCQLAGIKTIPGDYATLSAAISSLNTQGVGAGGVTFNISAGYTETFANSTSGLITATGTAANPIVFQKSGNGANPIITAGTGVSEYVDGIFVIKGGDYITFDSLSISENSSNTNSITQMEWGFALVKESSINGSQHNVIKNCTINLSRKRNSTGICVGNHSNLNTSVMGVSDIAGTNSYNKIDGNRIFNSAFGISIKGYNYFFDQGNEIGIINGNIIDNFSITNGTGQVVISAIYVDYNNNAKISNNFITTDSTNTELIGILLGTTVNVNIDVTNNTFSVSNILNTTGIESNILGVNSKVNILNNKIQNCIINNNSTNTITFYPINNKGVGISLDIANNQILNNATYGIIQIKGILCADSKYLNVTNNTISGNTINGSNGYMLCVSGPSNCTNFVFSGNTISQNSIKEGTLIGLESSNQSVKKQFVINNTFANLQILDDTIPNIYDAIGVIDCDGDTSIISGNIINGISVTSGNIRGILNQSRKHSRVFNNNIFNLEAKGRNSNVNGIVNSSEDITIIYNNLIYDLKAPNSTISYGVCGLYFISYTSTKNNVFHNTVYLSVNNSDTNFSSTGLILKDGARIVSKNNIIINKSSGKSFAIVNLCYDDSDYQSSSNNNCLYAGIPSSKNLLYFHNNQGYQIIDSLINYFTPRDSLSFSENANFINTVTPPFNLHINSAMPTFCESSGKRITSPLSILEDIDGDIRGLNPDVGADEFEGIALGVIPLTVNATVINSQKIKIDFTPNPYNRNVMIIWNTTGVFSVPNGTPPILVGDSFASGYFLFNGTSAPVIHSGLTNGITYYYIAYPFDGTTYLTGIPINASPHVLPPDSLVSTVVSDSKINLTWAKNIYDDEVVIASNSTNIFGSLINGANYNIYDTIAGGGKIIYIGPANSFMHEGLTNGTHYYYKSWSKDEFNSYSSSGSSANVRILICNNINTYPYFESFNDTLNNPLCWTVSHNNGNTPIWFVCSNGTTPVASPHSPGGLIRFISGSYSSNGLLFSRPFDLQTSSYQVSFWMFRDDYRTAYLDKVNVYINSTPSTVGATLLGTVNRNSLLSPAEVVANQWYRYSFDFPSGSAGIGKYLIFQGVGQIGNDIYVDDIRIDTISACARPTALFANSIKDTSAILHWSAGGFENNWEIEYGSTGFIQGNGTIVSSDSTNFLLTGLNPNTMYSFFVRSRCNTTSGFSHWTGPYYFQTECEQVTEFPFEENFDFEIFKPVCWKNFQSAGPGYLKRWGRTTAEYCDDFIVPYRGTGMAIFDSYSFDDGVKALLITPSLNLPNDQYQVNFWMYRDWNSVKDSLNIYFNTQPTAGGTLIGTINRYNSFAPIEQTPNKWYHYSFNFPSGSAGNYKYVIFEGVSKSGSYIAVDDIQIDVQAPCPKPTSISSQTILGTDTRIGWVAGSDESSWEIEYGLAGFDRGTGTFITADHNSDTLTGLSQGRTYSCFIRANCSMSGGKSLWAGPYYFTTPVTCYGPNSPSILGVTKNSATITWYYGGSDSSWNIQYGPTGDSLQSGTTIHVTSKPHVFTGLSGGTQYTYYLQSVCGGVNGNSYWSGPYTFWTNVSCFTPFNLSDTLITDNSITVNWVEDEDNASPVNWEVEYGPYGYVQGSGTIINTNTKPLTINGLQENTLYSFRVRTNCGGTDGFSRWSNCFNSKTACGQITSFPFIEGFNDTSFVNYCWINKSATVYDTTDKWVRSTREYYPNCFPHSGSGMAKFFDSGSGKSILVTPALQLPADSFQVKFWMFRDSYDILIKDSLNIYYNTYPNTQNAIKIATINRQYTLSPAEELNDQWFHYTFNLPVGSMGNYRYVIFEAVSRPGKPILIDDLEIDAPRQCKTPSNLGTTSVSDDFANITWTPEGNETTWNIEYGLAGFIQGSGISAISNTNTLLIAGLQPTTVYSFYVQANCGGSNGVGDWAGPYYFTTTMVCPSPTSLNVENILSTSATLSWNPGNLENSWQIQYGRSGFILGTGTIIPATSNPYVLSGLTPGYHYEFYVRAICDNGSASSYWTGPYFFATFCTQPIDLQATEVTSTSALLGWDRGSLYESSWNIIYGLAGFSPSTANDYEAQTNQYPISGLLPNSNYQFYVIALCDNGNGSVWSANNWVGPFDFTTKCTPVITPTATNLSPTSVSLGWISTNMESLWNIRYKKALDASYTLISNVTTNPYVLSGLEQNTAYLWSVNVDCNNNVSSAWSSGNDFSTPVGILENTNGDFSVFSSNNQINVVNNDHLFVKEVVIYDLLGQEVGFYEINSSDNIFISTNFSSANYIVKVRLANKIGIYKLFIQ